MLNSFVGFVIGIFNLAGGLQRFVRAVVEERICQRPTDALVEQNEHECGFGALIGEAVAVGSSDALQ